MVNKHTVVKREFYVRPVTYLSVGINIILILMVVLAVNLQMGTIYYFLPPEVTPVAWLALLATLIHIFFSRGKKAILPAILLLVDCILFAIIYLPDIIRLGQ